MMFYLRVIGLLFLREWYRIRGRLRDDLINYYVLWPLIFGYGSCYLAPLTFFGTDVKKATMLFIGMILLQIVLLGYYQAIQVIHERTEVQIVQYHITVSSYSIVFVVRALFGCLYTLGMLLPFFPVVKCALGSYLYTEHVSWLALGSFIALSSLLSISYSLFLSSLCKNMAAIENMWERGIEPLLWLGGMWAPLHGMTGSFPIAGLIGRCNPFMYVTEGVRQIFFQDTIYLPLMECCFAIVSGTIFFGGIAYILLRRQVDAV